MADYLIRCISIEDTKGWKASFAYAAEAATSVTAAFLVETDEKSPHIVPLGRWHQVCVSSTVHALYGPDVSYPLRADAHNQHMIAHNKLPVSLGCHLANTPVQTDDCFEWPASPFVCDSPVRNSSTAAAVVIGRSPIWGKRTAKRGGDSADFHC